MSASRTRLSTLVVTSNYYKVALARWDKLALENKSDANVTLLHFLYLVHCGNPQTYKFGVFLNQDLRFMSETYFFYLLKISP